jgi:hypothetical protein
MVVQCHQSHTPNSHSVLIWFIRPSLLNRYVPNFIVIIIHLLISIEYVSTILTVFLPHGEH